MPEPPREGSAKAMTPSETLKHHLGVVAPGVAEPNADHRRDAYMRALTDEPRIVPVDRPRDVIWPPWRVAWLEVLWADSMTTRAIADAIGISRNSTIGKCHRLNLTPRPSPIKPPNPSAISTRRSVARALRVDAKPAAPPPKPAYIRAAKPAVPSPPPQPQPPKPAPVPVLGPVRTCQWPTNNPERGEQFQFCGAPVAPGKPYCPVHCCLAYVKIRDRREDAA